MNPELLEVSKIEANGWNPNVMGEEEYKALRKAADRGPEQRTCVSVSLNVDCGNPAAVKAFRELLKDLRA